jgi:hypothetical protein
MKRRVRVLRMMLHHSCAARAQLTSLFLPNMKARACQENLFGQRDLFRPQKDELTRLGFGDCPVSRRPAGFN